MSSVQINVSLLTSAYHVILYLKRLLFSVLQISSGSKVTKRQKNIQSLKIRLEETIRKGVRNQQEMSMKKTVIAAWNVSPSYLMDFYLTTLCQPSRFLLIYNSFLTRFTSFCSLPSHSLQLVSSPFLFVSPQLHQLHVFVNARKDL